MLCLLAVALGAMAPVAATAALPTVTTGFPIAMGRGPTTPARRLSPISTATSQNEIIVGAQDGKVYAYEGDGGLLWQYDTGTTGIASKPAIADIDGDGQLEVVVGAGSTLAVGHDARRLRDQPHRRLSVPVPHLRPRSTRRNFGVYSSPALAELDFDDAGRLEIAFGAWDFKIRVINHDCTAKYSSDPHRHGLVVAGDRRPRPRRLAGDRDRRRPQSGEQCVRRRTNPRLPLQPRERAARFPLLRQRGRLFVAGAG